MHVSSEGTQLWWIWNQLSQTFSMWSEILRPLWHCIQTFPTIIKTDQRLSLRQVWNFFNMGFANFDYSQVEASRWRVAVFRGMAVTSLTYRWLVMLVCKVPYYCSLNFNISSLLICGRCCSTFFLTYYLFTMLHFCKVNWSCTCWYGKWCISLTAGNRCEMP